ncbi:hypothetical protein D3C81_2162580 [compost metagenome]
MAFELTDELIFGQAKFLTKVIQLQHLIYVGVHPFFRFMHKSIVLPPRCGDLRLRHKASQLEQQLTGPSIICTATDRLVQA